jgi:hypothetical protein
MRVSKLIILILIVCILGILVKMSEYSGDRVSAEQDMGTFDYQIRSINAPEFASLLHLLSEQSLTDSTQ